MRKRFSIVWLDEMRPLIVLVVTISCARFSPSSRAPSPAIEPTPAEDIGQIAPAVDLSGSWTTGSDGEPQGPTVVTHTGCSVNPAEWVLSQEGDSIRAWAFPVTYNQGVATKGLGPERMHAATGRISGIEVRIDDAGSHYRLRYDVESQHLRGTLNGKPFWAVRHVVMRPGACGAIP